MEKNDKPIIAIETSGENCGVCLYTSPKKFVELNFNEKNIHSEILFELTENVLSLAKSKLGELRAIAVSTGPGSFTGLRIGLSAAKGLALGANLPLVPVPTFEALALYIAEFLRDGATFYVVRKVNVSEHYVARFGKTHNKIKTLQKITLMKNDDVENIASKETVFSEFPFENSLPLPQTSASTIAKWAYLFGGDLLTYDYDFLEPEYFKNFIPKVKK